jgi:U3 small nucleolar RNA-associated protein 23
LDLQLTPVITQCCIEALYRMGKEFQPVVDMAKRAERRKCNHREAIAPGDCLKDMVGE